MNYSIDAPSIESVVSSASTSSSHDTPTLVFVIIDLLKILLLRHRASRILFCSGSRTTLASRVVGLLILVRLILSLVLIIVPLIISRLFFIVTDFDGLFGAGLLLGCWVLSDADARSKSCTLRLTRRLSLFLVVFIIVVIVT